MRGNRRIIASFIRIAGSIPAYAGEPQLQAALRNLIQVYPRVCGGTFACPYGGGVEKGLSPRMRGNR